MTLHEDEKEVIDWVFSANRWAGDFLKSFTEAIIRADDENYGELRLVLFVMMDKYPDYGKPGLFPATRKEDSNG